ncbi:MAG: SusC/RagA family TonB-linked outer membrane protein [Candidatus Amulumruptor caecigallinarius]|nr:SusC/RagA family TonB-linked outer membrane protein [Candidatus Amulumruptor caecigallinarius]
MKKLFLIMMSLIAVSWSVMAQTTISGSVVDAGNDEPLIGVTIMPVGGGQGTATDIDGKFTLTVPSGVTTAKVSYVGYKEQTVKLQNGMVIHLASSSTNLDDVVVVAYGTANKESLTGSVAVVGSKEISERPVTSVTTALEGSSPGVNVNSSTGYPGSSPSIRIRGFNSFSNKAQDPLYVVDGIVFNGSIAELNPADVESMSVLKDAASCALYGSRGANGVVLITTKKAKGQGKVDVNFQMNLGAYEVALPLYDRLNAEQWMEASLVGYTNNVATKQNISYADALAQTRNSFVSSYLKGVNVFGRYDIDGNITGVPANEMFDENGRLAEGTFILPGYNDLNWWDAITRTGFREEYNLNAAGSTDKFDIFASAGYLKQDGYVIETDYERFTGRLNANFRPVSYFKAGINLAASYTEGSTANVNASDLNTTINPFNVQTYAPIQSIYQHDENGEIVLDEQGSPVYSVSGLNSGGNIIWATRLNKIHNEAINMDGSIYGTAVIPYGFELTLRAGMYRSKSSYSDYSNNQVGSQAGVGGLDEEFDTYNNYTFNQALNWSHEYGLNHIDVLLSHENNSYNTAYSFVRASGQKLDNQYILSNFEEVTNHIEGSSGYRTESYLGRVRYNWDQKYFGEFSINRDGTSQFHKDKRWGTFWSVGASWIISKEKFMQNLTWLDYLKFRAAYGAVGNNQNCGYYNYLTLYSWTGTGHLVPDQLAAPDLKWESTNTLDLALEGSLFNDRFNFSIGFFDKRNADLIYSLVKPWSGGQMGGGYNPSILTNIGEMQNLGWELSFGVDIIRNANLVWNFNCDFSFIKNKIKKLPDGKNLPGQALFQGKSLYENYNYEWAGVDMSNGRSLYEMNPDSPDFYSYNEAGEYNFNSDLWDQYVANAKADGVYVNIDGKDYTYKTAYAGRKLTGTKLPTVYGSFGTNLSWKGIHFGMLFTYSLGGKIQNSMYQGMMSVNDQQPQALHKDILGSWTEAPADLDMNSADRINPHATPINNSAISTDNYASNSSQNLISASYLTLKNINLSYDLPAKWVSALKLQNINIGFQMENAFIATAMKGLNPEASIGGAVGSNGAYYQPARTYTFQLNVRF